MKLGVKSKKKIGKDTNMETKQLATKQPVDQENHQRGNRKIPGDKGKWKHNSSKSLRHRESSSRGKFLVTQALLKKLEKSKIRNLI